MIRRGLAFFGHAPALWLFYRETIPPPLRRPNAIAVMLTLAAMAVAYLLAPGGSPGMATFVAWVVGHFAWGAFLAARLPDPPASAD